MIYFIFEYKCKGEENETPELRIKINSRDPSPVLTLMRLGFSWWNENDYPLEGRLFLRFMHILSR